MIFRSNDTNFINVTFCHKYHFYEYEIKFDFATLLLNSFVHVSIDQTKIDFGVIVNKMVPLHILLMHNFFLDS